PVTIAWLVSRSLGSVVLVPIAEELAFRGFLYRWLIARKFEEVSFAHVSLIALVVSSLLFGMLHERWLAASLSGAVFALVMWRERHVCAAIVAHAAANAVICAWAIVMGQWTVLEGALLAVQLEAETQPRHPEGVVPVGSAGTAGAPRHERVGARFLAEVHIEHL